MGRHLLLGDLPDPGIEPRSPALLADSLLSAPPGELQVKEFVLCGCHFKTHSEDHRRSKAAVSSAETMAWLRGRPSTHECAPSLGTRASALEVEAEGELGGVLVPRKRDQVSLILRG